MSEQRIRALGLLNHCLLSNSLVFKFLAFVDIEKPSPMNFLQFWLDWIKFAFAMRPKFVGLVFATFSILV